MFTQILLDHGFGAAGVAINSAPTEGVKRRAAVAGQGDLPGAQEPRQPPQAPSASRTSSGTTRSPTRFSEEESRALYERYHVPASGAIFWGSALANIHPGHRTTATSNYNNDDRAPLLFISGSEDHLMPPSIQHSNAKHYKSEHTVTEVKEFEGPHLLPAGPGWEEVADYALEWALEPRARRARCERRPRSPTSAGRRS